MPTRAHDRFVEEQRERDRRDRLEHDEYAEFVHELELADRIADQASLPPGDPLARAAARHRLRHGPAPYERPHEPEPPRFAAGERVRLCEPTGERPGRVVRALDREGLVEVDVTLPPALRAVSAASSALSTQMSVIQSGGGGGSTPGGSGVSAATSLPRSRATRMPPPSSYSQPNSAP